MVYIVIALFFGLAGGIVGRIKGSSFVLWFILSATFPIVGLAAAVLYRFDTDEPRRHCPTLRARLHAARRAVHPLRNRARLPRRVRDPAARRACIGSANPR